MLTQYEIFMKSFRCLLITSGVAGNLLSFLVFSRSRTFKNNSISTYGKALAIADMFILFDLAYELSLLTLDSHLPSQSDLACKLFYYFSIAFTSIPGWILAVFSVDKLLKIKQTRNAVSYTHLTLPTICSV